MKLFHRSSTYKPKFENVVDHTVGVVFINEESKSLPIRQGKEEYLLPLEDELKHIQQLFKDLKIKDEDVHIH